MEIELVTVIDWNKVNQMCCHIFIDSIIKNAPRLLSKLTVLHPKNLEKNTNHSLD